MYNVHCIWESKTSAFDHHCTNNHDGDSNGWGVTDDVDDPTYSSKQKVRLDYFKNNLTHTALGLLCCWPAAVILGYVIIFITHQLNGDQVWSIVEEMDVQ